jgi:hypothetical protein
VSDGGSNRVVVVVAGAAVVVVVGALRVVGGVTVVDVTTGCEDAVPPPLPTHAAAMVAMTTTDASRPHRR